MNPLADSHPDGDGYACDGDLTATTEPRSDGTGTYKSESCADCGAFFEDGELIGHNLDAAEQRASKGA